MHPIRITPRRGIRGALDRRRAARTLLLAAAVVVGSAEVASAASSTPTAGRPWGSGATIKVYSQLPRSESKAVDLAIAQLNASGAKVKLKRVASARGAHVVMKRNPRLPAAGLASQGKPERGVAVAQFRLNDPYPNAPYQWAMLYVHELGHVLGLNHPRSARACTVMNSRFFDVCPTAESTGDVPGGGTFTCRLLQQNDKAALVKLYGGRPSKAGPLACSNATGKPISAAPAVPGFSAEALPPRFEDGRRVGAWARISWTAAPGFLIQVHRATRPGACPISGDNRMRIEPEDVSAVSFDAARWTSVEDSVYPDVQLPNGDWGEAPAGTYCFEARLVRKADGGLGPIVRAEVAWTPATPPAG